MTKKTKPKWFKRKVENITEMSLTVAQEGCERQTFQNTSTSTERRELKIGLRHSKVNLPAANNEELHRCAFTTNPNMPTSSNGGKHFFFYFMQHAHTNALHQSVHVEYGSRLKQAPTPRHLSSFIIHIAIYHTLTPAVHTNKSLQHYKHGKGVAVCVGDCI